MVQFSSFPIHSSSSDLSGDARHDVVPNPAPQPFAEATASPGFALLL